MLMHSQSQSIKLCVTGIDREKIPTLKLPLSSSFEKLKENTEFSIFIRSFIEKVLDDNRFNTTILDTRGSDALEIPLLIQSLTAIHVYSNYTFLIPIRLYSSLDLVCYSFELRGFARSVSYRVYV